MCHYIESICIEKGQIQNLSFHNKRFNTTRKELFGSSSFVNLEDFINAETHFERTKCRVIYDQEIIDISYQPYKLPSINCLSLVFDNEINYKYKSTDRNQINQLFDLRNDADDILIVKNGLVTDTSFCNIALWNGMEWETPAKPLLKWTRREQLLGNFTIKERNIYLEDIYTYNRIRLFNAMIQFGEIDLMINKFTLKNTIHINS